MANPIIRKLLRRLHYTYFFMAGIPPLLGLLNLVKMRMRSPAPHSPRSIDIALTNRCNQSCKQCSRQTKGLPGNTGDLNLDDFIKIAQRFKDALSINLGAFGEVTLNKDFYSIIAWSKANTHAKLSCFTNGTLIDRETAQKIVISGLDVISVSIDAATLESHSQIRNPEGNPGVFNKVVDGIKLLQEEKTKGKSSKPQINISFAIMPMNRDQIKRMIGLAELIGVKCIGSGEINPYWSDLGVSRREFIKTLLQAHKIAKKSGIHWGGTVYIRHSCSSPWKDAFISWDGFVVPCCWNPYPEKLNFGNVFERPFAEIWHSRKFRDFRRSLSSGRLPDLCKGCPIS